MLVNILEAIWNIKISDKKIKNYILLYIYFVSARTHMSNQRCVNAVTFHLLCFAETSILREGKETIVVEKYIWENIES